MALLAVVVRMKHSVTTRPAPPRPAPPLPAPPRPASPRPASPRLWLYVLVVSHYEIAGLALLAVVVRMKHGATTRPDPPRPAPPLPAPPRPASPRPASPRLWLYVLVVSHYEIAGLALLAVVVRMKHGATTRPDPPRPAPPRPSPPAPPRLTPPRLWLYVLVVSHYEIAGLALLAVVVRMKHGATTRPAPPRPVPPRPAPPLPARPAPPRPASGYTCWSCPITRSPAWRYSPWSFG